MLRNIALRKETSNVCPEFGHFTLMYMLYVLHVHCNFVCIICSVHVCLYNYKADRTYIYVSVINIKYAPTLSNGVN